MKVNLPKNINQKIAAKVMTKLVNVKPKTLWCSKEEIKVVEVDRNYRAYQINGGTWEVVTTEKFHKLLTRF